MTRDNFISLTTGLSRKRQFELINWFDELSNKTCERCKYYGCVDENIYSNNVCSQYQKVFINKRDGFHLLKCIKEPHNSCDLWECKDD